ncbi:MAG: cytochrome b5 domain-containing protein [bacterium]
MQTKNIIISLIVGCVVIGGAFYAVFGSSLKNLKQEPITETPAIVKATDQRPVKALDANPAAKPVVAPVSTSNPVVSGYTLADVQKHNSTTTCWSAVNGTVYDLTSWVNAHPGGKAAILMICGKDGSALFNAQHGGSGKVATILAKFKIGSLN